MNIKRRIKKLEKSVAEMKNRGDTPVIKANITADKFTISRGGLTLLILSKF